MADPAAPQLPGHGQVFLDHIGWMVPDMAAASAALERLGLLLTPYSEHANLDPATGALVPTGTANRLAMLPTGYLEILTPVAGIASPLADHVRGCIARYTGVHLVAFSVADAASETSAITGRGFTMQSPAHLRRTIEGADGRAVEVAFTVARPAFEQFPEGRVQVLSHHTPEHMWQERYLPRETALTALAGVTYAVDDPAAVAERFARFLGRPPGISVAEQTTIQLDRGFVRFMTRRAAAQVFAARALPPTPCIAGITLSSHDLERTNGCLLSGGLHPGALRPGELLVDAAEALGVHIAIVAA